jgi:hypothetical protein
MESALLAILMALQETSAYQNSSGILAVILFSIVIAIIMVCLLIIGVLSLGEGEHTRRHV